MAWYWWYLIGAAVTGIALFRRPKSWIEAVIMFAVAAFWPLLWALIISSGWKVAMAKIRGDSH